MKSGYQVITSWDKIHTRRHTCESQEIHNKLRSKDKSDLLKLKKKKETKNCTDTNLSSNKSMKLKIVEGF